MRGGDMKRNLRLGVPIMAVGAALVLAGVLLVQGG